SDWRKTHLRKHGQTFPHNHREPNIARPANQIRSAAVAENGSNGPNGTPKFVAVVGHSSGIAPHGAAIQADVRVSSSGPGAECRLAAGAYAMAGPRPSAPSRRKRSHNGQ